MKFVMKLIKKLVISLCMLYTFNLIISNSGYMVPINVPSITISAFLGMPAILSLLILKIIIK
ncbi:MAG: pro-sigmaK processing inhibitor BofA family protein [Bacilli bacterium]|nr:pro-sigmaK processing inhibitor BofA family protein [Bacilli bacterium]